MIMGKSGLPDFLNRNNPQWAETTNIT